MEKRGKETERIGPGRGGGKGGQVRAMKGTVRRLPSVRIAAVNNARTQLEKKGREKNIRLMIFPGRSKEWWESRGRCKERGAFLEKMETTA